MRRRGSDRRFERRLRKERPEPREEFLAQLVRRIEPQPFRRQPVLRAAAALAFTFVLALAIAITGGIGYAGSAVQGGATAVTSLVTGPDKPKPEKGSNAAAGASDTQSQPVTPQAPEEKVTICHVPPGNPENPQTITVGASAVPSHLEEHEGDAIGPCPEDPSPPDDQYKDKVLICHIPPGNEGNPHIIRVSENAVPAHVAHGDPVPPDLGPCD